MRIRRCLVRAAVAAVSLLPATGVWADGAAPTAAVVAAAPPRLSDGRHDAEQIRFDNLLMRPVPGWKKRNSEWTGQWTLEGPDFDKLRIVISGRWAVTVDEKGLAAVADAEDAGDKKYIDWREESPRVEGTHPAGYKMLTTFSSVEAKGFGPDARLYLMNVYLEANHIASHLHYAAAYRENFDKHLPTFQKFVNDTRLLSDQVLAPGFGENWPLEQFTVNQCCDFIEWLLDVPLTDEQRLSARDHFVAAWNTHDEEELQGLGEVFEARNKLNELDKEKKELARVAAREEVIRTWREEAARGDAMAKLMVDVYDQAHKPIAEGEPPLTRQQADATLEILHFMASKVAGYDVSPSKEQKDAFAKKLVEAYPSMPEEAKREMAQMPLYWAYFRAGWPDVAAEERNKLLTQWRQDEKLKPIVTSINDAKAKAIAEGKEPLLALQQYYQHQQNVAAISNMMSMQHMSAMSVIQNIGSSPYEYKYVYRYR